MPAKQITLGNKRLAPQKAVMHPDFRSKTVLVADTWDYVKMWLKRKRKEEALFFWEQAAQFYEATLQLPNTAAPLTAHYCFLNAVKTLLKVHGITVAEFHGVSGSSSSERAYLSNEFITFRRSGVFAAFCQHLGESASGQQYSLKDILYNLPYIHRAYILTFSSRPELFIPIRNPIYVKKLRSTEAWFCAEISDKRYANQHTINKLPADYEQDNSPDLLEDGKVVVRRRNRFQWRHGKPQHSGNLQRLTNYHRTVRKNVFYIHGTSPLWYIKRGAGPDGMIDRSTITLTYAAMHRLSELARYNPMLLDKHLNSQHNWLLSEFIVTARVQFINEISSEITGQEFTIPGRRTVS